MKHRKKIHAFATAAVVAATNASAGSLAPHLDEPEVIAPPAAHFDGPYVTVGAGIAGAAKLKFNSEAADNITKDAFAAYDLRARSVAEIGYRWQRDRNVYGIAVSGFLDFGDKAFACDDVAYQCRGGISGGTALTASYGRVLGKRERTLAYVKAGAAWMRGDMWHRREANGDEWSHAWSEVSPMVGVGVQRAFGRGLLVGLDLSYIATSSERWDINVWGPHDHTMRTSAGIGVATLNIGWQF